MILEKLNNKVNPKKYMYRPYWKLETDKNLGTWEQGVEGRGERGD